MKKICILFLLAFMSMFAGAETIEIKGIYYNLDSKAKTAEVTRNPNTSSSNYSGKVVIPKTVTHESVEYTVISIGDYAFYGSTVASLIIPSSVTSIGENAFSWCSGLTSITVKSGNSVYDSRNSCNAIIETKSNTLLVGCKTTTIPSSVTSIGSSAFCGCTGLTSITIPNSVVSIGNHAYSDCSSLTTVIIGSGVSSIGEAVFDGCNGLKSITVKSGNSVYDSRNGCNAIIETKSNTLLVGCKTTTIPSSITGIGSEAFSHCYGLTSITIPSGVTSIGDGAFNGCIGLTSITIPSGVTSIGDGAFNDCYGLTSITIPSSVISIGCGVFSRCTNLGTIKVESGNSVYDSRKNCNAIIKTKSKELIAGCKNTTIPNGVTSIGDNAFEGCGGLTSVVIPNSVTSIGDNAFEGCGGLTSVTISSSVTSISAYTFCGCPNLSSVTIPNGVTAIGECAFMGCGLTSVVIPNSVTSIGLSAFRYCRNLTSVKVGNGLVSIGDCVFIDTPWYDNQPDGVVYVGKVLYRYKGTMLEGTRISIKEGTYCIAGHAFDGCRSMASVTIPNSVKSIGEYAFSNCWGLFSVTIPNSVTTIGNSAFSECRGLTSIAIPNSVTSIGDGTFWSCIKLTSVTIPNSVTYIGSEAFHRCTTYAFNVYCYAKDLPTMESDAFDSSIQSYSTLYVLASKVNAYKSTSPWNGFKNIVEIEAGVKLNKTKATLEKGKTLTLKPTVTLSPSSLTDQSVTWKSSNTAVATVTSTGKVKGVKAGTATITCTSNATGMSAKCKVTVGYVSLDKTEVSVKKGKTVTLTPTVYPSSLADKSVTWKSSNTKVATVTSAGKVKGVKAGTAIITCTSKATGLSTTCKVTVGYVKLDKSEASVKKGSTVTLKATVYPSTLEDKRVTWKSSNTAIATVTSGGRVKGVKAGTATITCTSNATGLSTTCKVTVTSTSSSRSIEGDGDDLTGIMQLEENPAATEPYDVYDLSGRKVRHQVTSLDGLPVGVYIINGKKILKK